MTLIYNVAINGERDGYVAIRGERIDTVGYGAPGSDLLNAADETVDGQGQILLPGAIDCHVHFRDPGLTHKADMDTESRAALAGGVTSVVDMPNTVPQTVSAETLREKEAIAESRCHVNYAFFIGATDSNISELTDSDYTRVAGVKLFIGSSTGNMLVDDDKALELLFSRIQAPICVHAEDEGVIRRCREHFRAVYDGRPIPVATHSHIRPAEACVRATARAIALAEKYGTRLHIAHVTTAAEVEMIARAKARGKAGITCEVSPHHLLLCDEDYPRLGTLMKMNPAVKSASDRQALRQALAEGIIDMVATDHAPHLLSEKKGDALTAVSGAPIVQWAYPLLMDMFGESDAARFYARNPASVFGIAGRGAIAPGYFADLVLASRTPYTVQDCDVVSKCGWTYLDGTTLGHSISRVWLNGRENGHPRHLTFGTGH